MSDIQTNETESLGHIVTADELEMDEATIIRETERLKNEKKKKKAAKTRRIILIIVGVLVLAGIWFLIWGRKLFIKEQESTVAIKVESEQDVTYVKVESINGNELNVAILKERVSRSSFDKDSESNSDSDKGKSGFPGGMPGGGNFGGGEMPDMSQFGGGEMPDMSQFGGGEMPDMSQFGNGEMPDFGNFDPNSSGFSFPGQREGSEGNRPEKAEEETFTYDGKTYSVTSGSETIIIPVGTEVTTKLGTKTTFSRISAGDYLAIVTEAVDGEITIMSVYIIG